MHLHLIHDVGQWMSANRLKLNTEKTEQLWAGSRHGQSSVTDCRPSLQLGADTIKAQDDVRLLGVTISSDLSLQRHVSNVSSREMVVLVYTAIFEKNMRNSTVNYLIPDWLTAVT